MSEDRKCSKPGCGALNILGKACLDRDCPQLWVHYTAYNAEIDRINAQLAEARDRGLEDAAVWHDYQVSDLEEQIKRNDEYRTRTGNLSAASEANDFCRSLQSSHRISAVAIRALKGKT